MPSPRLSTRPRFDRGPIARGLGQVPRRRSLLKKSTRLEEGDDKEEDKDGLEDGGDDEKPKDKPDDESEPDSEMEEGDETDPEDDEEGDSKNVDMKGGKFGAGIIRRFSVITRGEALGHGFWIDATALQQCADAINGMPNGLKSRFTHPSLSSDGMGKLLGRAFDAEVEGDRVLADLHMLQSAHDTPDGDLAAYVMGLAEEDPTSFGTSISFEHDEEAEEQHFTEHGGVVAEDDYGWKSWDREAFQSDDPDNVNNYCHMRLKELRAVDAVDEPAANPNGMFHHGGTVDLLKDAEALFDFVLGVTQKPPKLTAFQIDPERVKGFATRYASQRKLQLGVKLKAAPKPADPRKELGRFVERFGAEHGAKWFTEGISWDVAIERHLAAVEKENTQLRERIKSAKLGEKEPLGFSHPPKSKGKRDGEGTTQTGGNFAEQYGASLKLQGSKTK